ncbi:MAG: phosphatidylglycerol lysyltransferase domain-containing protein [Clostridia bacterium]|nr:phosphatidylglycerol lysyltransferase domain-containing protein [Clostridia bacterium]
MDSFKAVTIDDQQLFCDIFSKVSPTASELTFPYLFMWKRDYNLSYSIVEGYLCMVSQSRVSFPFAFCPIPLDGRQEEQRFKKALEAVEAYFKEQGHPLVFGRVEEARLEDLKKAYGNRAAIEPLDSASDYVYLSTDLATLAGKKLSGKRNHINQFLRLYDTYEYISVEDTNLHECRRILDDWCDKNETECVHPDNCERLACYELLDNWSKFNLKGALIKVAGKFEAFTVGELLNPETAVIRIEKGNSEVHGIYTLINREFVAREWPDVKYINREEDMGLEGLRKSKLSYNPVFMVNKFLVKV